MKRKIRKFLLQPPLLFISMSIPAHLFARRGRQKKDIFKKIALGRGCCLSPKNIALKRMAYHINVGFSPSKTFFICCNDSPSKIMKNALYFILKAPFVLSGSLNFSSWLFGFYKNKVNLKIFDVTTWLTNIYNTNTDQISGSKGSLTTKFWSVKKM